MTSDPVNLFGDLKSSGFHSSIGTTFSIDAPFYDDSVQRRLRAQGCLNNILIVDERMLARVLSECPEGFAKAGRQYAVVPVRVNACFHPKLLLRLGASRGRLIIGSANITARGWGGNREIVGLLDWRKNSDDLDNEQHGQLIRKGYNFLADWVSQTGGEAIEFKLGLHKRDAGWLFDIEANQAPLELSDGTAVDLLFEKADGRAGILSQLIKIVGNRTVKRLIVVSPYWDDKLDALRSLRKAFGDPATIIALDKSENTFPTGSLRKGESDIRFCHAFKGMESRFVHSKIIIVEADDGDHVLFGSANCTTAAIGNKSRGGRNAEACIYRRLKRKAAVSGLGLSMSEFVSSSSLKKPAPESDDMEAGPPLAGHVELVNQTINWWPPASLPAEGAVAIIPNEELEVRSAGLGAWRARLKRLPVFPLIARFRLADGRITAPTLVHDAGALRQASPGEVGKKLMDVFNRIEAGEADLIDLLTQANLIFTQDRKINPAGGGSRSKPGSDSKGPSGAIYGTPEEFRKAAELSPANGSNGRYVLQDPGLLYLLQIIMRGVSGITARNAEFEHELETSQTLLAGEDEDGNESTPKEPADPIPIKTAPRPKVGLSAGLENDGIYSLAEMDRRRNQFCRCLDLFQEKLSLLAADPSLVDENFPVQALFVFHLMVYATQKKHKLPEGKIETLLDLEPTDENREYSFPVRVLRMLQVIWEVRNGHPSIAQNLRLDLRHQTLPVEIFALMACSVWAAARALRAARQTGKLKSLSDILTRHVTGIFEGVDRLYPLDNEAEIQAIREWDREMGFDLEDTDALVLDVMSLHVALRAEAN